MAVLTRSCGVFPCSLNNNIQATTAQNAWNTKSCFNFFKTQLCTIAVCVTLFNSVRLPREAFKYGAIPYLVVYSFWLLLAALPATLLQLTIGQLTQQDPVGVWRAVPILRGVGHLKLLTSYICCIYNMVQLSLSVAYLVWITKGTFPLKDCTKLRITPHGYENKMNASECFNSTFLAPFAVYPQYLGIMAIISFVLWFFLPIMLYRLRKTLKVSLDFLTPVVLIISILLCTFLSDGAILTRMISSCEQWMSLQQPYLWHSSLVQALLSTQIVGGYLISAGGTLYRHSDVRWSSTFLILTCLLAGWLWVMFWESIGGEGRKDTSFITILVLIYQSSVSEKRLKQWPILAFALILISGIITVLMMLFPLYDKLHRMSNVNWRLYSIVLSASGTILTVGLLSKGLEVTTILDELVVPTLAIFTTAVELVGFVFIYGWCSLRIDIEFLTGIKLPWVWVIAWWIIPFLLLGATGWWLRALLRATWGDTQTLWPLVGVFVGILIIMVIMAAIAVAKEEQYNLFTKITAAFRPSRLWGPEEPMARYVWMSQRYVNEVQTSMLESNSESVAYPNFLSAKYSNKIFNDNGNLSNCKHNKSYNTYIKNAKVDKVEDIEPEYANSSILKNHQKGLTVQRFRSPNVCIAEGKLGGPLECNCNRHFTLNVPTLKSQLTTSL